MDKIVEIINDYGPLTGKELLAKCRMDEFSTWKACYRDERLIKEITGTRYLRLDRQVEGYARLSPSIVREFFGYTVIGTKRNILETKKRAELLRQETIRISNRKFKLARDVITKIAKSQGIADILKRDACIMIAGDVVYEMSHLEPRPESSTGKLVKGSDLDIVVITRDVPNNIISVLDESIYKKKYFLLKNPSYNEELDYVIKDITKVKDQLKFDNFESMVASKVLYEGKFLYGSEEIFKEIKTMLAEEGIPEKLNALEIEALANREKSAAHLLKQEGKLAKEEDMKLFYTKEEREEFF